MRRIELKLKLLIPHALSFPAPKWEHSANPLSLFSRSSLGASRCTFLEKAVDITKATSRVGKGEEMGRERRNITGDETVGRDTSMRSLARAKPRQLRRRRCSSSTSASSPSFVDSHLEQLRVEILADVFERREGPVGGPVGADVHGGGGAEGRPAARREGGSSRSIYASGLARRGAGAGRRSGSRQGIAEGGRHRVAGGWGANKGRGSDGKKEGEAGIGVKNEE